MPIYEYLCESNGRVLEVQHKMAEQLQTWGELCARIGISAGKTDPEAPVTKLISAGFVSTGSAGAESFCEAPACGSGACGGPCSSNGCDFPD